MFLLPPDMRDWLPSEHLVWMVIDTVAALDLRAFRKRAKLGGAGRAPLDPGMLLALLIYAYAHGQRSSRQIERLCETDIAFKVICGNRPPDHTVIARFRARHDAAFAEVFAQVLVMCAKAGLGRFGTVAIDGTKIAANASKHMNRSEDSLRAEAARILAEAAAVDAAEDAEFGPDRRGDELPPELADPVTRAARIKEALAQIEAEKAAETEANRVAATKTDWDAKIAAAQQSHDRALAAAEVVWKRRSAQAAAGVKLPGRRPVRPEDHCRVREARDRIAKVQAGREAAAARAARAPRRHRSTSANTTDPESRLLPVAGGFIQGFNAQLAVTGDQIIAAVSLGNAANDKDEFIPMMNAAVTTARRLRRATRRRDITIGTVLADAGYFTEANLTAAGPDRLIATSDRRDLREAPITSGDPPEGSPPAEAMRHRTATADGRELYRHRSTTVEPVNGHLKDRTGLRHFSRRGTAAALGELNLAAATLNLLKLHRAATA